jgi:hypothetical protein
MIKSVLTALIFLTAFCVSGQNECEKSISDMFRSFQSKGLNTDKYCFDGDYCNVYSNLTDTTVFDLIFEPFNGWGCTKNLKFILFYADNNEVAFQKDLTREDVKFLNLTYYPDYKNNLVVRLNYIPDLNLNKEYCIKIKNDKGKEIYNSGRTIFYFISQSVSNSCD